MPAELEPSVRVRLRDDDPTTTTPRNARIYIYRPPAKVATGE